MIFFVAGIPKPGGSKKAFRNPKTNRIVVVDDCTASKDWRACVTLAAYKAMDGKELMRGPLKVQFRFQMPRPKGHYSRKGGLKPSAPTWPATRPDVLKLSRSTEDALTGIVWEDDAQIVHETISKHYVTPAGFGLPETSYAGCMIQIIER